MDQYHLHSPTALVEKVEAEFIHITRTHLKFWKDVKEKQNREGELFMQKSDGDVQEKTLREKRSGIENILQVSVTDLNI